MHEALLYCLEALPMLIAIALWNVSHPGKLLVGPDSEFPKKQSKSKTGERYHELDDLRLLQTSSLPV
jgi:hypothetical protein